MGFVVIVKGVLESSTWPPSSQTESCVIHSKFVLICILLLIYSVLFVSSFKTAVKQEILFKLMSQLKESLWVLDHQFQNEDT